MNTLTGNPGKPLGEKHMFNHSPILSTFLGLSLLAGSTLWAQSESAGNLGKQRATGQEKSDGRKSASAQSPLAVGQRTLLAKDVTVQPNTTATFEATDFAGATNAAIAIYGDPSLRAVRIAVTWAGPDEFYVATQVVKGDVFFFQDHGGFTTPVYGPGMKVMVTNEGTAPGHHQAVERVRFALARSVAGKGRGIPGTDGRYVPLSRDSPRRCASLRGSTPASRSRSCARKIPPGGTQFRR